MMFVAIVINYMDRANFTVSVPLIEKQFGFDIGQMGQIAFIWGLAYALFNFPGGWFADKLGIRKAASFALGFWSIFTVLSAVAYSMVSWCVIRGFMGVGEAPIWPINAKTTSTWSAPTERRPSLHAGRFGAIRRLGIGGVRFRMDRSRVWLAMDLHHLRRARSSLGSHLDCSRPRHAKVAPLDQRTRAPLHPGRQRRHPCAQKRTPPQSGRDEEGD